MVATKQKRCPEGYGVKSLRFLREAKARGMHLSAEGEIVLPTGKRHTPKPQYGRNRLNIGIDGEVLTVQTARAVCFLAHGEPPNPTSVVDHIDGDTLNDHPDNLRWATYSENTRNTAFARNETWEQKAIRACAGMADPAAEIAKLREDLAEAVGALEGFVECARYSPHMDGNHSFMGWRQSDLRGAESRARKTLAKINKGE